MTLLLHLWSCRINHNISATQTQPYLTDTLIRCGLGNLIGSSMLTWGLLVPSAWRGLRKDTMVDGWWPRRCQPSYSSIAYTICNTRDIWFLLCLYLKRGNKLNVGIVWFEGKATSRTSKTCLTMVEPFAGPCSMAMGNQPMPSRYTLRKRLSEGRVQGFLLTLCSGGKIFFFSNHINFMLIWYTTQLDRPQMINSCFPCAPLADRNFPPSPPLLRRRAFGWLLCNFHSSVAV